MSDRPNAVELLAEARPLLLEELAPALEGDKRYQALMIANAMGIAEREIPGEPARLESFQQGLEALGLSDSGNIVRLLRNGRIGGDPGLYRLLLTDAEARARISNPDALGGN